MTRLKHFDTIDEEEKARLTIQGFQDAENNQIVSNAPTVSHASIRILISFAAIKVYPVWTKDTAHAFLQSKNTFSRDLYVSKDFESFVRYKGGWDILEHRVLRRLEAESRRYSIHAGFIF
jgi:hypothetical protein